MPALQAGGVRIFEDTNREQLEDTINRFLAGDGTIQNPKKKLTQAPVMEIDTSGPSVTFYVFISYEPINQ